MRYLPRVGGIKGPDFKKQAKNGKKPTGKMQSSANGHGGAPIHSLATGSIALIDGGGLKYFINTDITFSTSSSASAAMSEASYTQAVAATTLNGGTVASTLNDAYDGYNTLCVSPTGTTGPCETGNANFAIYNKNGPAQLDTTVPQTPTCAGRQVVFPQQVLSGVTVQRKVFVPTNDTFARWMNIFTNNTAAPITVNMDIANNLGSDSNTTIVSTSSGDAVATTTDQWVTTFQNYAGTTSSDPRLGHVLQGAGAPVQLNGINFANGDDNPWWSYPITLAPGQTKIILNFGIGTPSKAAANAKAAQLANFSGYANAQQCMSATELGQVVNFLTTADLSITKSSTPSGTVIAGSAVAYTLNVSNAGPSPASAVSVTDTLPPGFVFTSASGTGWTCNQSAGTVTCTLPSLAVGPANPITINGTAPAAAGPITNTATVSATNPDPNSTNNTATNNLTVVVQADLSITKSTTATSATSGFPVTYSINVTNAGPNAASNVVVTDVLPAGSTFNSASGTGWTCSAAAGTVTCTRPTLAVGAAPTISLTMTPGYPASHGATLANTASVSSSTTDPTPGNNAATTAAIALAAGATVPALSPLMMMLLAAVLTAAGALAIRRS